MVDGAHIEAKVIVSGTGSRASGNGQEQTPRFLENLKYLQFLEPKSEKTSGYRLTHINPVDIVRNNMN